MKDLSNEVHCFLRLFMFSMNIFKSPVSTEDIAVKKKNVLLGQTESKYVST